MRVFFLAVGNHFGSPKKVAGRTLAALLLAILICPSASAHHLWVFSTGQAFAVGRGLAPNRIDAYDPSHVEMLKAFDIRGREIPIKRADQKQQAGFTSKEKPSMAVVTCDWGLRVNTSEGKKFISRKQAIEQGLTVLSAFQSLQYAKSVFDHGIAWNRPLGLALEIVALKNPHDLEPEEPLTVQVLFEGKPLSGCQIGAGSEKPSSKTDQNGIAHIGISKPGLQIIMAIHKTAVKGSREIDYKQLMSFLTFAWP